MPWPSARDTDVFSLLDRELERQNTTQIGRAHV